MSFRADIDADAAQLIMWGIVAIVAVVLIDRELGKAKDNVCASGFCGPAEGQSWTDYFFGNFFQSARDDNNFGIDDTSAGWD